MPQTPVKPQESSWNKLMTLLEEGRLPHAMLFVGPPRARKREMATELAKALLCQQWAHAKKPCGSCPSCVGMEKGSHPDFVVIERAEEDETIKIEPIRELLTRRASLTPIVGQRKVFLIDEAERLREDAQNAILKTLEEPEGRTFFVLTTAYLEKLLGTIKSRAHIFRFVESREDFPADEEEIDRQFQRNRLVEYVFIQLPQDSTASPPVIEDRAMAIYLMEALLEYLRDLLLAHPEVSADEVAIDPSDLLEKQRIARGLSVEEIERRIEKVSEAKADLLGYVNVKLILMNLWNEFRGAAA